MNSNRSRAKLLNRILVTCTLSTIITQPAACAVCVTIFKNGGKFRLVAIFTQLLALTVVGRSNALLYQIIHLALQCCVEPDVHSLDSFNSNQLLVRNITKATTLIKSLFKVLSGDTGMSVRLDL